MMWFSLSLLFAGAIILVVVALAYRRGRRLRRGRRRGFVEFSDAYRSLLREEGLTEPAHVLGLEGMVVSGHSGRDVSRLILGSGPNAVTVYLKREWRVPWTVRLESFFTGFGLASRSLREARTLQALQRELLPAPEWMAVGEDGRGAAFLMLREVPGAIELREYLRKETDSSRRRRTARRLGRELARLHEAGFAHPDLYAKHVLVDARGERVWFLDWQRSWRGRRPGWSARRRDLAALHVTLADELATPRERLTCLHAYLPRRPQTAPKRRPRPGFLRALLAAVDTAADRLRRHRHIAEKRQTTLPHQRQEWRCIEGQALCVTPGAGEAWLERGPDGWLSLDRQPASPAGGFSRRWLAAPDGERALLVRRNGRLSLAEVGGWLLGRSPTSPEQRQATLLFRLQRHAVPAPCVLAMGQRQRLPWQRDSFLLTAPDADAVRLDAWLSRRRESAAEQATRRRVLREAGAVLHRMHEASCYLRSNSLLVLAVRSGPKGPQVIVSRPDFVETRRRPAPSRARRDLAILERSLSETLPTSPDWRQVRLGYESDPAGRYRTEPGRRSVPSGRSDADVHSPAGSGSPRAGGLLRRLLSGVRRLRERPEWLAYAGASWADGIMQATVTDRFNAKQGRSTGRWILPAPAGDRPPLVVYLKRHYSVPAWQRWLAALWPRGGWSPAIQEWRHLEWARARGVPVPEALAAAEFIGPAGQLQSCLAVRELTGMLPLNDALPLAAARLDPPALRRWKQTLAVELARLTRLLHDRHCFHKDLYFCHFYVARGDTAAIPPEGWQGRVFLIDLHRLRHHPLTRLVWQTKDLAQLLYSSELPEVDVRDRLSFWRAYRPAGPRRALDRWLRGWVLFKWRRYRRHNARRKARAEAARARQAG
jgi:heptose I phosphotransferase